MFRSINPATGEQIATYPELSPEELDTKLNQAVSAFHAWRLTRLETRTALLSRIADAYKTNKDRLAHMATEEMGKTYASAIAEVEKCIAAFRHYAQHGPAMLEPPSTRNCQAAPPKSTGCRKAPSSPSCPGISPTGRRCASSPPPSWPAMSGC